MKRSELKYRTVKTTDQYTLKGKYPFYYIFFRGIRKYMG